MSVFDDVKELFQFFFNLVSHREVAFELLKVFHRDEVVKEGESENYQNYGVKKKFEDRKRFLIVVLIQQSLEFVLGIDIFHVLLFFFVVFVFKVSIIET